MYRKWIVKLTPHARFSTLCLHAGQEPDPSTGAIITPIYQTSTYVQEALGRHKGYEYARTQNPTRAALERNLAAIEGGKEGFAFASGMAAIGAVATLLKSGDHVVVSDNTYGGTFRLFDKVLSRYELSFSYVDTSRLDEVERAFTPATRLLFVETPTNPVMQITDLAAAAELAHRHGARLVVDNTFASPCLQRPIEFGADLVVHSTTKYLNGHSDSIGGVVDRRARRRHRVAAVRAERGRRHPEPVRLVARAARHQDAPAPDGAAQRERSRARACSSRLTRRSGTCLLSRVSPRTRSTRSRRARCAASAGCCRSTSARSRRRAACSTASGCWRSPKASAAWRR